MAGCLLPVSVATQAQAQTVAPSQILPRLPQGDGSETKLRQSSPLASPDRTSAPEGAEALEVQPGSVTIEGGFPEMETANKALIAALSGRKSTLAAVYGAIGELEAEYARAGYVLARATLPPQRIEDGGVLRILVIDGFIEAIDDVHVPTRIRHRVERTLAPLVGKRHLRLADIERRLQLADDIPGADLRSALVRGTSAGGTRLAIEGTFASVSASLALDNSLPESLDRWLVSGNVTLNDPLGLGEQFYVMAAQQADLSRFGFGQSPFAMLGTGLRLPLGYDGLTVSADYVRARSRLRVEGLPLTIGKFERGGARLDYDALLGHGRRLRLSAGIESVSQLLSVPAFGIDLSRDRYAALGLGAQWQERLGGGALSGQVRFSQGLGGRGVPEPGDTPFSRVHARPDFSKIEGRIAWSAPLDAATSVAFVGRAQGAFGQPLFLSEQFALGGPEALSAAAPGSLNFDSGASLRGELSHRLRPFGFGRGLALAPYLFSAIGWGWLSDATAVEQSALSTQAIGGGLRVWPLGSGSRFGLSLEYGHCFCGSSPSGSTGDRLSLSAHIGI